MLLFRGVILPIGFIIAGVILMLRILPEAAHAGLRIVPALVLALALIALGIHRIRLVASLRKAA